MNDHKLEKKVEDTLASLDGLQRIEASEFFYTRLKARMAREANVRPVGLLNYFYKPSISIAALMIAVLLNVFAIFQLWFEKKNASAKENTALQSLAKQYDLDIYTAYDNKSN